MEFIRRETIVTLSNSGVQSEQLLFSENSASERVTITRVTVQPGLSNPRHSHESSEQIWVALSGHATLLLSGTETHQFRAGDVVRFVDRDIHGITNSGAEPFVYISVTAPPINFRAAYAAGWKDDAKI